MKIHDRIRFMRMFKGWSQEKMAEKLGMDSVSGYAKIEHGETDINFSRLQQIADLFEIELPYLIGLNERNVFNVIENCNNHSALSSINISPSESDLKHENERLHLINEQQAKEIDYLKEIISLLKKTGS